MTNLILVVDDDNFTRMQLRNLLEQAGYRVTEASHGEQAIEEYKKEQPDLVLLDVLMPGMDGITCCARLQTLPGIANTPVLMITGLYDKNSVEQAFAVGATDYITKPIHWQVLRQRVRRLLEARRTMEELRQQTEQAQSREEQFRMALEAAQMSIWNWDILNNQVTWSERSKALFRSEDSTFEAFIECVHPQDRDFVRRSVKQAMREGTQYDIEFRVVLSDNTICWMASKGVVFRDSSGVTIRMSGVDINITKRKLAEEALEVYANRQALLAELSQLALSGIDLTTLMHETVILIAQSLGVEYSKVLELLPDGNFLLLRAGVGWQENLVGKANVSAEMNSQAGYTLMSQEPVIVTDMRTERRFSGPPLLHRHKVVSGISVIIHGKERPFGVLGAHSTQMRVFSRDDIYFLQATANLLATAIERQKVEDALRESEQRWQLAMRGNNDGIWDWIANPNSEPDAEFTNFEKVFFSTRWKEILGYSESEISNNLNEWAMRVHPNDINRVKQVITDHFAKKTPFYISEYRIRCKDDSYKWILDRGQALWDENGKVLRMTGSHTDITERKLAEEKLRQSEERFQIVARATNDIIWDWDLMTNKIWWNEGTQRLFGFKTEVGETSEWWFEHIHPDDRQRMVSEIQAVIANGEQFWSNEYRFRHSSGSYAYIYDRAYVVRDRTGKPVRMIGAVMDITERKQVQEELQRQNLRSKLFADVTLKIRQSLQIDEILQTSVTEVQKLLQADRVLIFRVWSDGSGMVVKEAVVPGFPAILGENITDPCFQQTYIEKYRQGRISVISDIRLADIEPCYVEFLQQFATKAYLIVPILLQNELWGLLITYQCTHPRQWTDWETELLQQLANQMGIALAQAKMLEREIKQREELSRSNEELQQFAFVASHDLQEPLRKIKTFGDRLKATCSDAFTEQGRDYLERMQNAARRMQALIEDLLMLSRVTTRAQPFSRVNLTQITHEVLSDLEVLIQQNRGRVEVGELPTIKADPVQMRQLLQNLIGNALKFHRLHEPPVVKVYSQFLRGVDGTELCQIVVEDNGIGFDEKYLDRIFNVFQRLHGRSEYEGTGVGLAICRKIIERHHGRITAKSKPQQGASFIITLPINSHA
ncbi:MAG: PAS domain-containing protein [Rhizonema sp. PD38]|nr:PAS domain-containing protein [Rhizonema sp. PD38]